MNYHNLIRVGGSLMLLAAGESLAQSRRGIDCDCDKTGSYVPSRVYEVAWTRPMRSPHGIYEFIELPALGDRFALTITRDGQDVVTVAALPLGASYGFSPDDHRFVAHYLGQGGQWFCRLFDLEAGGVELDVPSPLSASDITTVFSPHGRYLLIAALGANNRVTLRLISARTGGQVVDPPPQFTFTPGISDDLGRKLGVAGWGFSPDDEDATFHYAYTSDNRVWWNALNLPARAYLFQLWEVAAHASFSFSPCGDVIAVSEMPTAAPASATLIRTLDGEVLASDYHPGQLHGLYSTAASHCIDAGPSQIEILPNTAAAACPGSDPRAPSWPSGAQLTFTSLTLDSLTFTWPEARDDDGQVTLYQVEQLQPQTLVLGEIPAGQERVYRATGLPANTTCRLRVRARDNSELWSGDLTGTATTLRSNTAPTWPIGAKLTATKIGETNLTLNWPAASDDEAVTGYRVYQDSVELATLGAAARSLDVTGLLPATRYRFKVEAGDGDSNWTTTGPAASIETIDQSPPVWPADARVWASETTPTSLTLTWTAAQDNVGVSDNQLYVYRHGNFDLLTVVGATSHRLTCLQPATTFEFKVEAGDAAGNLSTNGPQARLSTAGGLADCQPWLRCASVSSAGDLGRGVWFTEWGPGWGRYGAADSEHPSLSADGRFVAFESTAVNLVRADHNTHHLWRSSTGTSRNFTETWWSDIFVRDRFRGATRRANVSSAGAEANGSANNPSLSADGTAVVFDSIADNLVVGDGNQKRDVFLHNIAYAGTTRVSWTQDRGEGNDHSYEPVLSADGQFVAFTSFARNLVSGDTNSKRDVFVWNRQTRDIVRVSVSSTGEQGNDDSWAPAISADGRFVVFLSRAGNLVPDDLNYVTDVFVHDRQTGATTRVSVSSAGDPANNECGQWGQYAARYARLAISADGRFVAFDSAASNLVPDDTNNQRDVFVHDRQTGQTERVSISTSGEQAHGPFSASGSGEPSLSADGRWVSFTSNTTNLVQDYNRGLWSDVFLRDREGGTTVVLNRCTCGNESDSAQADEDSGQTALSADGRFVAFASHAGNLLPNLADGNFSYDIFVLDRSAGAGDADGDGLPDATEQGPDGQDPNYDGNGDGIPDSQQHDVLSLRRGTGQLVTFQSFPLKDEMPPEGWCSPIPNCLASEPGYGRTLQVGAVDNPDPGSMPPGVEFPLGLYQLQLRDNLAPGAAVLVTLLLPGSVSCNTYYKYGPTADHPMPHWYEFLFDGRTGAILDPSSPLISIWFVDGARGDSDLAVNGIITDPGGPARVGTTVAPALAVSDTQLAFGWLGTELGLTLTNTGDATLSWSIVTALPAWLRVEPASGHSLAGGTSSLRVRVGRQGLEPGSYTHTLAVVSSGGVRTVPITMMVPLEILSATLREGSFVELQWRSSVGVPYRVQGKHTLGDAVWQDLSPRILAASATAAWLHTGPGADRAFYRIIQLE